MQRLLKRFKILPGGLRRWRASLLRCPVAAAWCNGRPAYSRTSPTQLPAMAGTGASAALLPPMWSHVSNGQLARGRGQGLRTICTFIDFADGIVAKAEGRQTWAVGADSLYMLPFSRNFCAVKEPILMDMARGDGAKAAAYRLEQVLPEKRLLLPLLVHPV